MIAYTKEVLQKALTVLISKGVIPSEKKLALPSLAYAKIDGSIYGTNLNIGAAFRSVAQPDHEPLIINARILLSWVKMLDKRSVVIFEPKKHTVLATGQVGGGESSAEFGCLPDAEFPPYLDEASFAGRDVILDVELKDIHDAWAFASRDDKRYLLNSIVVDLADRKARSWRVVATDGRRLYCSREHVLPWMPMERETPDETQLPSTIMLPLHDFLLLHTESGPWRLRLSKGREVARVQVAGWTCWVKLVDGVFPNYRQVIPKNAYLDNWHATPTEAQAAAKLLDGLPLGDRVTSVKISYETGVASVEYANPSGMCGKIRLPGVTSGQPAVITVNRDYMVDCLNAGAVRIGIRTPDEPLMIQSEREATMVLMPCRT